MSTTERTNKAGGDSALESVRRLEETLEGKRGLERAAEARLAEAREEAERIVRGAREEAEAEAEVRRRAALARADEEAARLVAGAEDAAGTLRARAEDDRLAAAREVAAMILPRTLPVTPPGREA